MYFEEQKSAFQFMSGLIVGAMLGAGIALLMAPASGKRTRRKMLRRVVTAGREAGSTVDDWSNELSSALRAGRRQLRQLRSE